MNRNKRFAAMAFTIAAATAAMATGPTSTLYIINSGEMLTSSGTQDNGLDRIQGNTVLSSTDTGTYADYSLAVYGDVRTQGTSGGYSGSQFDLAGNLLSPAAYFNPNYSTAYYDGTSDGVHNYAVDWYSGNVDQFDRNWNYQTTLFSMGTYTVPWITMNVADGTLWLGNYGAGTVDHYTTSGSLISSFNTGFGPGQQTGIALDPADGTLWMSTFSTPHTLYQFDQAGNFLQSNTYALGGYAFYGAEFDTSATRLGTVPEPASMAALGVGVVGLLRRRKK